MGAIPEKWEKFNGNIRIMREINKWKLRTLRKMYKNKRDNIFGKCEIGFTPEENFNNFVEPRKACFSVYENDSKKIIIVSNAGK